MELVSSWEQRGIEQGLHQGKEQILNVILEHRFSTLPSGLTARLDKLTSAQMDDLAKALFAFESLDDLEAWLARQ